MGFMGDIVNNNMKKNMKKTYWVALLMIALMSAWMVSGILSHKATPSEKPVPAEKPLTHVRVQHLTAQLQRIEVVLRGHTEAKRMVDVKAEIAGRVTAVKAEKGQRVKAGDVLCELAEDDRREQLAQAQAAFDKANTDYQGALQLKRKNLLSESAMAAGKSMLASAKAALKVSELALAHTRIKAPFAGVIETRPAEEGALLERGAICTRLMDEGSLLATAQASEKEVLRLALALPVTVTLSSGESLNGKISFIGRSADALTRTYRVEATLDNGGALNHSIMSVRDGITAQIHVPLAEVVAHRISPALLALDDGGHVGVRTTNTQQRVEFHPVDVIRESAEGVWVTGLPTEIDLITVGQELVAAGDSVAVTRVAEDAALVQTKQASP